MTRTTITTVAQWEQFLETNAIPETQLVEGCGPRTRFNEAKRLGVVQKLSDWSREHRISVDVLVTPELSKAMLGIEECEKTDRWNFHLGSGKDRVYYRETRNNRNRKFVESNVGTVSKGMLADAINGAFVYGPQSNVDCYGGCSNLQHRCKLVLKMESMGIENPSIWLSVDFGHHPATNSKYDRPKVHKLHDDLFKDATMFPVDLYAETMEYVPDDFDYDGARDNGCKVLVTLLTNLYGRLYCAGWTASYHPGGAQSPSDDNACDMLDNFDATELFKMIIRLQEAMHGEDGKKRLWSTYLPVPMVATAIVLASNATHEDKTNLNIDETIVDNVIGWLAETADNGDSGYSPLVANIVKHTKGGSTIKDKDKRIFAGLVTATKALLADTVCPGDGIPSNADHTKIKKGKLGWALFGGVDEPLTTDDDE